MNQDPKQHWKQQVAERRAELDHVRSALRVASERHLRTGAETDAEAVLDFAARERLADQALTYAEEQLRSADVIRLTQQPRQLHSDRLLITRRMDARRKEREEQIAREREKCGRMPEHHVEQHLRNVFGRFDYRECAGDAEDKRTLARIDAELAEHARRDAPPLGAA